MNKRSRALTDLVYAYMENIFTYTFNFIPSKTEKDLFMVFISYYNCTDIYGLSPFVDRFKFLVSMVSFIINCSTYYTGCSIYK